MEGAVGTLFHPAPRQEAQLARPGIGGLRPPIAWTCVRGTRNRGSGKATRAGTGAALSPGSRSWPCAERPGKRAKRCAWGECSSIFVKFSEASLTIPRFSQRSAASCRLEHPFFALRLPGQNPRPERRFVTKSPISTLKRSSFDLYNH